MTNSLYGEQVFDPPVPLREGRVLEDPAQRAPRPGGPPHNIPQQGMRHWAECLGHKGVEMGNLPLAQPCAALAEPSPPAYVAGGEMTKSAP
jgi:hypothetical protein